MLALAINPLVIETFYTRLNIKYAIKVYRQLITLKMNRGLVSKVRTNLISNNMFNLRFCLMWYHISDGGLCELSGF